MYKLQISEIANKSFSKIRDKKQLNAIRKKISKILENPYRYKLLKGNMQRTMRVHVNKSFVIVFDVENNKVRILDYNHHDNIYKK